MVIGASAGGVEALRDFAGRLPANFPAAVLAVVHFPADGTGMLPLILARRARLPAVHAEDEAEIVPGTIYVARRTAACWWRMDGSASPAARARTGIVLRWTPSSAPPRWRSGHG